MNNLIEKNYGYLTGIGYITFILTGIYVAITAIGDIAGFILKGDLAGGIIYAIFMVFILTFRGIVFGAFLYMFLFGISVIPYLIYKGLKS